jgi:hypothetical protein
MKMSEIKQKLFLLEAGWAYDEGREWIAFFDTREAAESVITQVEGEESYCIFDVYYDHFKITDLREFVNSELNHESGAVIIQRLLMNRNNSSSDEDVKISREKQNIFGVYFANYHRGESDSYCLLTEHDYNFLLPYKDDLASGRIPQEIIDAEDGGFENRLYSSMIPIPDEIGTVIVWALI